MSKTYSIDIPCSNEYLPLHPVYLQVRRDTLLHLGVGNPDDPYDYTDITQKVTAFANDVAQPFVTLHKDIKSVDVSVQSPCDDTLTIPATASLEQWSATASCNYSPILYVTGVGIIAGQQVFMGIEQIVYNCKPGEFPYTTDNCDLTFKFQNGVGVGGGIGYVFVRFNPDDPSDTTPNAPGDYFFVIRPSAKIYITNS